MVEKCKALKDLENGMSNKDIAAKYGVPRNTVSTQIDGLIGKKGMNSSRKNTRCGNYERVDKTTCNWFIDKRNQEIPIDGVIIKEKALDSLKHWILQNSKHQIVC